MTSYHKTYQRVDGVTRVTRIDFYTYNDRAGKTVTGCILPEMVPRSDRATMTGFDFGWMCMRIAAMGRKGKARVHNHLYA